MDFKEGAEHRHLVVDGVEQYDGVSVVFDWHELIERCLHEPRLIARSRDYDAFCANLDGAEPRQVEATR